MKDEFPITRRFNLALRNISSMVLSVITRDMSHMNDFYKQESLNIINKCKVSIDEVENEYGYVEWSRENWAIMIRELLDSTDCRDQLQTNYNIWIKIVMNIKVWSDNDLKWLLKDRDEEDPIYNGGKMVLRQVSRIMELVYCLVQELKLEYGLYDEEDYQPMAFIELDYPNGPNKKENSSTEKLKIPNDLYMSFKDEKSCEEYFDWEKYTTDPQDWGKRFGDFGKPSSKLGKGDMKNIFDFLIKCHPDISHSMEDDKVDYKRKLDRFRRAIP
jgi:hypothetical protein